MSTYTVGASAIGVDGVACILLWSDVLVSEGNAARLVVRVLVILDGEYRHRYADLQRMSG